MKRRLLNVLTALSALLCAAVVGLWARGQWVCDVLEWRSAAAEGKRLTQWEQTVGTGNGVAVYWGRAVAVSEATEAAAAERRDYILSQKRTFRDWTPPSLFWPRVRPGGRRLGRAGYSHGPMPGGVPGGAETMITFPLWPAAVATAVPLGAWLATYRRRKRLRRRAEAGLCRACGYDLRATPGMCPECGTLAGPATAP
jgi:hypothetical protein